MHLFTIIFCIFITCINIHMRHISLQLCLKSRQTRVFVDCLFRLTMLLKDTVYPKKYAHGFCFAVLCCGYTLTYFPISIRLTSLALWQSNDCPSASKATLMNMDKYFMWIHYERLRNHNKAKHNKTVCIFLGIYCKGSVMRKVFPCHDIMFSKRNHYFTRAFALLFCPYKYTTKYSP